MQGRESETHQMYIEELTTRYDTLRSDRDRLQELSDSNFSLA